jgi:hypothetical protein
LASVAQDPRQVPSQLALAAKFSSQSPVHEPCEGEVELLGASDGCNAAAKAEAKLSVQCTPPRVAIDYQLKPGIDAEAGARLSHGMQTLKARLPALLVALARAEQTSSAGAGLVSDRHRLMTALETHEPGGNLRTVFGLVCAAREARRIPEQIAPAADRLAAAVADTLALTGALGLP